MTDEELAQMKQRVDMMFDTNYSAAAINYVLADVVTLLIAKLAMTMNDPRGHATEFMREARISATSLREIHTSEQYRSAELVDQTLAGLEASVHRHISALGGPQDGKSSGETD